MHFTPITDQQRTGFLPAKQIDQKSTAHSPYETIASHYSVQRLLGNQGVRPLIQARLKIGKSDDKYEQEADQVASRIMQIPEVRVSNLSRSNASVQKKCAACAAGNGLCKKCAKKNSNASINTHADSNTLGVQRKKNQTTQNAVGQSSSELQAQVDALNGRGQGLNQSTRNYFEPRFGYDFSHVRVHTDAHAANSAASIQAAAYTIGKNIVFGAGHYAPQSPVGKRLLAHELTHVVQQNTASVNTSITAPTIMRQADPGLRERAENLPAQALSAERSINGGAADLPQQGGSPDVTSPRVCGPDIGAALQTVWSRIQRDFHSPGWTETHRRNACLYLLRPFTPEDNIPGSSANLALNKDGFDVIGLYQDGAQWQRQAPYYPTCGIPGTSASSVDNNFDAGHEDPTRCSNAVTVAGECWLMGTVNYGTFGIMMRLCHDWASHASGEFFGEEIFGSIEDFIAQRQRSGETIGADVGEFIRTIVEGLIAQVPQNTPGLREAAEMVIERLLNNAALVRQLGASGAAGQMAANVANHAINLLVSSGVLRHTGRMLGTALGGANFFSRASLISYVGGYKVFDSDDPGPPLRWALATYDGGSSATAHSGNRSTCATTCPLTYTGSAFDYVWEPTRHRDDISWP